MNKKVAVILAGCGVYDGSEIHEAVIALVALDRCGAEVQCFAPDIPQMHVVNHLTGEVMEETRNVLVEAARIARGQIKPLTELKVEDFDALVLPGGFGAAKNLCDFATQGAEFQVRHDVLKAAKDFAEVSKPIGLICISPVMAVKIYGEGVACTLGDAGCDAAEAVRRLGAEVKGCAADQFVEDSERKLLTTPAYMVAQSLTEAATGIEKMIQRLVVLA